MTQKHPNHRRFRHLALLAGVAFAGAGILSAGHFAQAQVSAPATVMPAPHEVGARPLGVGMGKSVAIDLPRDAKDVLVANPSIANAVVRTPRKVFIIGSAVGQTTVFFHDAQGVQIAAYDVFVTRDMNSVRQSLKQLLPHADIRAEPAGDGIVITGTVASAQEAQQAVDLVTRIAGTPERVVNGLTVAGRDQVMLKVTVAEIQRDVVKQLGVDLQGAINMGSAVVNLAAINPFSVVGQAVNTSYVNPVINGGGQSVQGAIQAMERAGVIRTLAEPNLTAISGETANFLAGGEFPVPVGQECTTDTTGRLSCQLRIEFKKFGVGLQFTPVVMAEGRIHLKVATEVSELSNENSFTLKQSSVGSDSLTIPSIKIRRVDTSVQIPSGGSLVLAGMIQEQTKQAINGVPGLMNLPILGTLFRSRDFVNRQTELVVLVTPYTVRSVARRELARPDDGYADASDPSGVLLGRFNRLYGIPGRVDPQRQYHGNFGFIVD